MTTVRVVLAPGVEVIKEHANSAIQPVHGVHWLIDFYSLLDIAENADSPAIKSAIRSLRAQTHSDHTDNIAEEAREVTDRLWEVTDQAEAVLLDSNQRLVYDERLAWFKEHRPECISTDGKPIVCFIYHDLDVMRVDNPDRKLTVAQAESKARKETGYNPDTHESKLKSLHALGDEQLLLDYLMKRWSYLGDYETNLWFIAGFFGIQSSPDIHQMQHIDVKTYQKQVDEQIERKQEEIRTTLEITHRLALEGSATLPIGLLMPSDKTAIDTSDESALSATIGSMQQKALDRIAYAKEELKKLAVLKAETLQHIIKIIPFQVLNSTNAPYYLFCLTGAEGDEDTILFAMGGKSFDAININDTATGHNVQEVAQTYDGQAVVINVPTIYGLSCPLAMIISVIERYFTDLSEA